MSVRRPLIASLVLVLAGLLPGLAPFAAAQGGEPVTFVDAEGITRGTVTVRAIVDPFEEFDPDRPPEAGTHYVVLEVVFESAMDQTFEAAPYHVQLQGTGGTLYSTSYVPRTADAVLPDLESQTMAPGDRNSGVIGFLVPDGTELDRVVYYPAYDRLLVLVELGATGGPAAGEAVPITDQQGGSATVTIGVTDPFTEHDPNYPPEAGSRYVVLTARFENTGDGPFAADPSDLWLWDDQGFLRYYGSVTYLPDSVMPPLESQTMASGDVSSGRIGYVIPADDRLIGIQWWPTSSHMQLVADLTGSAGPAPSPVASAPAPTDGLAPTDAPPSVAPSVSPTPDASAGTGR